MPRSSNRYTEQAVDPLELEEMIDAGDYVWCSLSSVPHPQDIESDAAWVRDCVGQLRENDQVILEMAYWFGLTNKEIADELGCGPGAARVRLMRARDRLADVMAADDPLMTDANVHTVLDDLFGIIRE